jgi:glycogen synthase
LNQYFFTTSCAAILTASNDISQQVMALTADRSTPPREFLPTYRRGEFANTTKPPENDSPFQVLFVGRIERDKGVFDLLDVAKQFAAQGSCPVVFHLCGNGSALAELQTATTQAGLEHSFLFHGYCQKNQMREMFARSHVVIVPTRTEFTEGFNQVVAEGVLAGRPVVTSAVCPALDYVRDAVIEVPANDVGAYYDAICKLYEHRDLYEQKRQGCLHVQEQFYNPANGWGATLKSVLTSIEHQFDGIKA